MGELERRLVQLEREVAELKEMVAAGTTTTIVNRVASELKKSIDERLKAMEY